MQTKPDEREDTSLREAAQQVGKILDCTVFLPFTMGLVFAQIMAQTFAPKSEVDQE